MSDDGQKNAEWLRLLSQAEPSVTHDPAALGRAIRRWATLVAAAHRLETVTVSKVENVSLFQQVEVPE